MRCGTKDGSLTRFELKQEIQVQLDQLRRQLLEDFSSQLRSMGSTLPGSRREATIPARQPASHDDEDMKEVTKKGFRKNIETEFQDAMEGVLKSRSRSLSEDGCPAGGGPRLGPRPRARLQEELPFVTSLSEPRQLRSTRLAEEEGDGFTSKLRSLIDSDSFGYVITGLVLANAVIIGVETDYAARNEGLGRLPFSHALSQLFCYIFTAEVAARLFVNGLVDFFTGPDWRWNWFDFLVVGLQCFEQVVDLFFRLEHSTVMNFGFLRILRTLRVVRIMRLARVLHLVVELRTMVSSIVASLKPLFWATILFSMLIYAMAVAMTQIANEYRASKGPDRELERYFSNLGTATLALWECISGGMDWQDMAQPLIDDVSPVMALVFSGYVAFSMLAMMNVITGIFVDNAKTYAQQDKDTYVVRHVLNLFKQSDLNDQNAIDWEVFQDKLDTRELQELFEAVEVNVADAQSLFKLIDTDNSGCVTPDELMRGWIRLQGPAKALDSSLLLRDSTRNFEWLHRQVHGLATSLTWLTCAMETLVFPDAPKSLAPAPESLVRSLSSPARRPSLVASRAASLNPDSFQYKVLPQDESA